ncbi:hypothetical protein A3Q56_05533 [Intoshia linei]|uniref:FCP1 homology domain-containing protein n=1 Tax=Intoshia linei TaxID=1819745 RepID=A0A177AZ12_9BILA|nr:hypothetical protein A3Q56_05533 [Intoshia linei]
MTHFISDEYLDSETAVNTEMPLAMYYRNNLATHFEYFKIKKYDYLACKYLYSDDIYTDSAILYHSCERYKYQYVWPTIEPPENSKYTLVLDMDHTMVFSTQLYSTLEEYDYQVSNKFFGFFRPYLMEFLNEIKRYYEIIVFTAAKKKYADTILDIIDPECTIFSHRLYFRDCTKINAKYVKNLNKLNRDLKKTVIVDDNTNSFILQIFNGIPINAWIGDPSDVSLKKLAKFLKQLLFFDDVLPVLQQTFQISDKLSLAYRNYIENEIVL